MNIVFFGNPEFCSFPLIELYNSKYNIVSVVTNPDKKSGRGLKLKSSFVKRKALELNISVIESDDICSKKLFDQLSDLKPDLFVVVAFSILPDNILDIPKHGSINIHPSLLPKYRGSSPIQYSILNGDSETGVSIINLNSKIDSGNILAQEKVSVDKDANFGKMHEKLSILGSKMLIKVIDEISLNKDNPIKQDETKKTLAPKIKKNDLRINPDDWNDLTAYNKIRAFDPDPGAYAYFNDKRIKLFDAFLVSQKNDKSMRSGQLFVEGDSLFVCSSSRLIKIESVQLEGKRRILSSDFIKTLTNKEYIFE